MSAGQPEQRVSDRGQEVRARLLAGAPVTERRIDLAGVSTAVLEAGTGPPVVLLHGQGNFGAVFLPIIPALAERHRVIAPDLPGLGASEMRAGEPEAALVTTWLSALIDETCDTRPALIGLSLGGSIALRYAVDHSDDLVLLVPVSSGSLGPRPPLRALLPVIRHSMRPSPRSLERLESVVMRHPERAPQVFGERFDAFRDYMVDRARTPSVQKANRRLLRELGLVRMDPADLHRISVRTALVWGRHDRIMRLRYAEEASARYGWPLHVIDDAGHVVLVDERDATVRILTGELGHTR